MRIELRNELIKSPAGNHHEDFMPYIDTFLCDGAKSPLGAVLVLPGGGYTHRAYHEGDPVARRFNELGYHAFVLQYRVAPYVAPAPQEDVILAVKIIRSRAAEFGINPDQIAVMGFSAGAHLAASGTLLADKIPNEIPEFAEVSGKANALVLCYPVIALTENYAHRGSGTALTGSSDVEVMRKYDLNTLVDDRTPPAFLWHTADDAAVSVRNSMVFADKMWQCGNTCELHVFPHGPHGRGLGIGHKDLRQWPELAAEFLEHNAGFNRA